MSPEDGSSEEPWYASGLRFRCTACGECCTGAPGYVWVQSEDVVRMAGVLGLSPRRFRKTYARRAKGKWSLKERENGDCILLKDGKCTVYRAKPVRCSTFPFWPEVLSDPSEWEETAERCEGIGQGDLYTRSDVERLLREDPTPLFEKQARPSRAPGPDEPVGGEATGDGTVDEATWTRALADLRRLYADLEQELPRYRFTCAASGRCCDFDAYGHRLFVTTLEAELFFREAPDRHQTGDERSCPAWGTDRLCKARRGRMLGCRTYFCGPYPVAPPDDLYERYHRRLKALHDRHGIPFHYRDIIHWAADRSCCRTGSGTNGNTSEDVSDGA